MSHSIGYVIAVIAAWYVACGLVVVAESAQPGVLVDRETGWPKRIEPEVWCVVALLWPWFLFAWTFNAWVRR